MKVYDHLSRVVLNEGVRDCFALLGDANMEFATRLADRGCRMIYVRHEHNTVTAAAAYARKTGAPGFATVTCGPGLTQLMTALPAAVRAHLPLVVFAGEAPLGAGWYNQGIDQAPFVTATGAAYHALHSVARMPEAIRDAFAQARTERRPVVIGVPFDLQRQDWTGGDALPDPSREIVPRPSPMPPHPDDVTAAARVIDGAARIVVMAGLGAVEAGAGPACRALARRLGAPLATTLPARGLFHDDPDCLGIAGGFSTALARETFAQADLVIAVGGSLAQHNVDKGSLWPDAATLQIDTAPAGLSQGRIAARHHLRADARLGVEALTEAVAAQDGMRSDALRRRIATEPADPARFEIAPGLLDPRDAVAALEDHLPADWEMVNSSGHCSYFFAQMPSRPQKRFLTIREWGAIGNGISFAMGVAVARPDRPVVLFDGDGSLLMHIQEIEALRRHGLDVLIVVMNDRAYGSEIHKLRADGLSDAGAVFGATDLAAIARGFGVAGETVIDAGQIPDLVAAYARTGGVAVWDMQVSDQVVSPVIRRAHPELEPAP